MLSHTEAQELHQCIRQGIARDGAYLEALDRALELAAILVADTMGVEPPTPSPVTYDPCITGTVDIEGRKSEFMFLLDRDDVGFSQWGADNTVLWDRVDLLDELSKTAKEWWLDNKPEEDEDA
jgi:hypothetical protein